MNNPEILHKHMIVRAEVLEPFVCPNKASHWLEDLVYKLNMKILMGPFSVYCDKENNRGITSLVAIETSHIALHIWDEMKPSITQLDVYTCSKLDENVVFDHINVMKPTKIEWKYIDRQKELICVKGGFLLKN